MSQTIMGIDASLTGTGVVVLQNGEMVKSETITHKKGINGIPRILAIEDKIRNYYLTHRPHLIIIEGYAFSRAQHAHEKGELGGVLRRSFYLHCNVDLNCKWFDVSPSALKKFCTGKGNVGKEIMILNAFKRWGMEFEDDNQCDAFVLAKIGEAFFNGDDGLIKPQIEVMTELRKKVG